MGWKLDDNMKVSLVKEALAMAYNTASTNIKNHSPFR
jgi:hypothetical protein